ncbi:MAG: tetratricopeptide repeat-containing protein, partial [Rubrivivax sp.]
AAWEMRKAGNTWAAYQCYGDPDWRFVPPEGGAVMQQRALPELWTPTGLALLLENEALEARHADDRSEGARRRRQQRVRALQARYQAQWGGIGAVAEAFALAYADGGELDAAVDWYGRAVQAADGSASMRAAEQWANLMARRGAARADVAQARQEIQTAIAHLQQLIALHPTVERLNLVASAWKRLAMIGQGNAEREALQQMVAHYAQAEAMALAEGSDAVFYPVMNGLAGALRLAALSGRGDIGLEATRVATARQSLQAKVTNAPDFWSVVGLVELQWLEAVAQQRLAKVRESVAGGFADLAQRAPAPHMWKSVRDQALFVLQPYAKAAGGTEAAAAAAVLKQLQALAG